jgi:hypothetical protein
MTTISFTSGELLDIMKALEYYEDDAYYNQNDAQLASYYLSMQNQFQRIYEKLQELPGEDRVANLVLAAN